MCCQSDAISVENRLKGVLSVQFDCLIGLAASSVQFSSGHGEQVPPFSSFSLVHLVQFMIYPALVLHGRKKPTPSVEMTPMPTEKARLRPITSTVLSILQTTVVSAIRQTNDVTARVIERCVSSFGIQGSVYSGCLRWHLNTLDILNLILVRLQRFSVSNAEVSNKCQER